MSETSTLITVHIKCTGEESLIDHSLCGAETKDFEDPTQPDGEVPPTTANCEPCLVLESLHECIWE